MLPKKLYKKRRVSVFELFNVLGGGFFAPPSANGELMFPLAMPMENGFLTALTKIIIISQSAFRQSNR